ncbi:tetratricopeptide repeat protein [Nocardia sp. NPDC050406]|uniref:tetratricopeptide repeat protein n=1 Tax=Nocardia sp. NPDC050406 TaxID=3364318 RepID=UPI0037940BFE
MNLGGEGESDLLRAGARAREHGDLATALRLFEQAAREESGDLRLCALVDIACVTDESGDHARAVELFHAALAQIPPDAPRLRPAALLNLSQALQRLGDLDAAQHVLDQARTLLTADTAPGELRFACLVSATALALHRHQWPRAIELANESLTAARRFAPEQAGHPLMNLAAAHFETGRWELAEDFATQALAAFEAVDDRDGIAESRQNLALMRTRTGRFDEAEPLLRAAQEFFETAGIAHRAGIGWKLTGFITEHRGDTDGAAQHYRRALHRFEESGALLDAADVRLRLATLACAAHQYADAATEFAAARATYAARGLGMHCAQLDYWHAALLEPLVQARPDYLPQVLDLAVPAALALDAVRYELPDGAQRHAWNSRIADPALRVAFRYAYLAQDARLLADLIETRCAGTIPEITTMTTTPFPATLDLLEPFDPPTPSGPTSDALQLGSALAAVAASAGLPVSPPPRVAVAPDAHIALADWITAAEQRYGRRLRDDRVVQA